MVENKVSELVAGRRDDFETLALEVFEHQYSRVQVYRRLCDKRGSSRFASYSLLDRGKLNSVTIP